MITRLHFVRDEVVPHYVVHAPPAGHGIRRLDAYIAGRGVRGQPPRASLRRAVTDASPVVGTNYWPRSAGSLLVIPESYRVFPDECPSRRMSLPPRFPTKSLAPGLLGSDVSSCATSAASATQGEVIGSDFRASSRIRSGRAGCVAGTPSAADRFSNGKKLCEMPATSTWPTISDIDITDEAARRLAAEGEVAHECARNRCPIVTLRRLGDGLRADRRVSRTSR